MNLFSRLFKSNEPLVECPRCLGKGHVDWDDIKRMKHELKWVPGSCAYCNGKGKVDKKVIDKVPVDTTYLVNTLSEEEREKLINGYPDAMERAMEYEDQVEDFIENICFLHLEEKLSPEQIAEVYLEDRFPESYLEEKQKLMDYVKKVIEIKTGKN